MTKAAQRAGAEAAEEWADTRAEAAKEWADTTAEAEATCALAKRNRAGPAPWAPGRARPTAAGRSARSGTRSQTATPRGSRRRRPQWRPRPAPWSRPQGRCSRPACPGAASRRRRTTGRSGRAATRPAAPRAAAAAATGRAGAWGPRPGQTRGATARLPGLCPRDPIGRGAPPPRRPRCGGAPRLHGGLSPGRPGQVVNHGG